MKKWLVAYAEAGPYNENEIKYERCDLIEANTPIEAEREYEKKHYCPSNVPINCLGEYDENTGMVHVPLSIFINE